MKKLLMLTAAGFILQAAPALADNHAGGHKKADMFEKHDINGDGVISEAEFLENAKKKFKEKDANSDGSISKEEAKAGRKAMKEKYKEKREERKAKKEAEAAE